MACSVTKPNQTASVFCCGHSVFFFLVAGASFGINYAARGLPQLTSASGHVQYGITSGTAQRHHHSTATTSATSLSKEFFFTTNFIPKRVPHRQLLTQKLKPSVSQAKSPGALFETHRTSSTVWREGRGERGDKRREEEREEEREVMSGHVV